MSNKQLLQSAGDGTAVPAGYVGEKYESVVELSAAAANAGATAGTLTNLPAGVWLIQVASTVVNNSGTLTSGVFVGIPTTNASLNPDGVAQGFNAVESGGYTQALTFPSTNNVRTNGSGSTIVNITSPTTYYHRVSWTSSGGGLVGLRGYIRAVRIA